MEAVKDHWSPGIGVGQEEVSRPSTEDFQGSGTTLYLYARYHNDGSKVLNICPNS